MTIMVNGVPVFAGGASAISDETPIGTIIAFMGTSAPKGYLICDGAEYSISSYPVLADFFLEQFGDSAYFGGDGSSTFAVPDLKNKFLRGYHGDSSNTYSKEIGEYQAATTIPRFFLRDAAVSSDVDAIFLFDDDENGNNISSVDFAVYKNAHMYKTTYSSPVSSGNYAVKYAVRPINATVLFCIKAAKSSTDSTAEEYKKAIFINKNPIVLLSTASDEAPKTISLGMLPSGIEVVDIDGFLKIPSWNFMTKFPVIAMHGHGVALHSDVEFMLNRSEVRLRYTRVGGDLEVFYYIEVKYKLT